MKTFSKAALIVAAVLVILGCAFCAVSFGIGFSFPDFWEKVEIDNFSIESWPMFPFIQRDSSETEAQAVETEDFEQELEDYIEQYTEDYIEEGVVLGKDNGIAEEIAQGTAETAENFASEGTHFPWEDVKEIKVEANSGVISVIRSEDDGRDDIYVEAAYLKDEHMRDIAIYMEGDTLHVEEQQHGTNTHHTGNTQIMIYLPWNMIENLWLEKVELKQEYGSIYIDMPLTAEEIGITVKEGECVVSGKLTAAKELDVELSAGTCTFGEIETENLKMSAGAGEIYTDKISGAEKTNIKCGVGAVSTVLEGKETDYNFNIKCGVGIVDVGDTSFRGIAGEKKIENPGGRKINVECGMGTVDVGFSE